MPILTVGGSLLFSIGQESHSAQVNRASGDRAWRVAWITLRTGQDGAVHASAGGVLFLLFVAGAGQLAGSTAAIARRFAVIGLIAAALSIGVQGGLLTGGSITAIADPAAWQTGLHPDSVARP